MLDLVIFDVDGLMIDSERVWKDAFERAGKKYGIKHLGDTLFPKIVGKTGKDEKDILDQYLQQNIQSLVVQEWERIGYSSLEKEVPVKPGLYKILDFLEEQGIQKAVATTTKRSLTKERLEKIKVYHRFDFILCGDEVTNRKPNPEIYLKVLEKTKVCAKNALVLEDSAVGVEAAYHAGISCIQVPDIIAPTQKEKEETIQIVKNLEEAKDYIEKNMIQSFR